jgi:N-sulfoglucosamine sulfohydrolase
MPWMEYSPVDSAGDPGWKQMVAAHESGKLPPELDRAYFANPRPIYELYDLKADPAELNNVAGRSDLINIERSELTDIERKLRHALIEKMIIDFDYLPLPPE